MHRSTNPNNKNNIVIFGTMTKFTLRREHNLASSSKFPNSNSVYFDQTHQQSPVVKHFQTTNTHLMPTQNIWI